MSEYRQGGGGFQLLPPVTKVILIINVIVFLTLNITGQQFEYFLLENFALFNWKSPFFHPWQLITHMFMHEQIGHLFFNMLALWMFGNVIESTLGAKRFIVFYLICGLGASICYLYVQTLFGGALDVPMLGASGAIYGVLFAFGFLYPNVTIYPYFIPMKAKYAVTLFAVVELSMGLKNSPTDNVAHFAHIGGMIFAFLLLKAWKINSRRTLY